MKTYKKLALPALAAMMMLSPAFYQEGQASLKMGIKRAPAQVELEKPVADNTYVKVNVPLEKKDDDSTETVSEDQQPEKTDEVVAQDESPREKVEPLKLEPIGIQTLEVKIDPPKLELRELPAITTIDVASDDEEPAKIEEEKTEEEVLTDAEDKSPEAVVKDEDKTQEEVVTTDEDKTEEEVVSKEEDKKEEVQDKPSKSTFEELTGLVCHQQNQIDRMTASIDTLVQSMSSQMQLMQMMTQLMMMQQMAGASTPTYQDSLFNNPMMAGFQSFIYGQRMGSLMNIFSPIPSFGAFGANQQTPQAPVYNYNITGDFYGRDYTYQGAPQAMPQANLGISPYSSGFNTMDNGAMNFMSNTPNWLNDSTRLAPSNSPMITTQLL